ncbi:MAG: hypothetical protein GY697_12880 [Desulfobacterales bacterium]|nr:hypothetical protein [Desulfobacterales bacterium]
MPNIKSNFFKTAEYPKAGPEPSEPVFERSKIIGTTVKVMRTGHDEPDPGWRIVDVYFRNAKKKINRTLIKVQKSDEEAPQKGLQKVVPLELLERINPEIKLLIFEPEKDYVLYEDKNHHYKIGLVVDIDLEEDYMSILVDEGGDDITALQDRVSIAKIIDKNDNPRQLEKALIDKVNHDDNDALD